MGARVSLHVCHHAAGKKPVRAGDRTAQPTAEKLLTSLTERGWCQSPAEMFRSGFALWRPAISYVKKAAKLHKDASIA